MDKNLKSDTFVERSTREFKEQLARGDWHNDMTDEELDKAFEQSSCEFDKFYAAHMHEMKRCRHESPRNYSQLDVRQVNECLKK